MRRGHDVEDLGRVSAGTGSGPRGRELQDAPAQVGDERVNVEQCPHRRIAGGGVGDHRPAIGVSHQHDRTADGPQQTRRVLPVDDRAAKRIGRCDDGVPV